MPEMPLGWLDVVSEAANSLGPVVERYGLAVVLLGFALWTLYRLGFDYVQTLKESVTRAEAATIRAEAATIRAEEATARAEAERDEANDALRKYAEDTNMERRELLVDALGVFKRLKADPEPERLEPRDPEDPGGGD